MSNENRTTLVIYDDAQDALAAEYVLGTLSAEEREHAEALLAIDSGFAESVRQWERRLGELNVMVEAVEPPPAVWEKIRAEIGSAEAPLMTPEADIPLSTIAADIAEAEAAPTEAVPLAEAAPPIETESVVETPVPPTAEAASELRGQESGQEFGQEPSQELGEQQAPTPPATDQLAESLSDSITAKLAKSLAEPSTAPSVPVVEARSGRSAEVIQLTRQATRWRRITVAVGALAAVLALYIGFARLAPGFVPFGPGSRPQVAQAPAPLGARLVAVLQQDPMAPAFLLTVDPQSRTMVVRRVSATPETGRSYQLWLIAKQSPTPRSLGLVGNEEFTQRAIPGNFDMETLRAATYAISLEPAGGSPKDVPTGPVLFTGNIVQAVPAAPPPEATPKT
jgi:anti-sigma-K factor RskA